LILNKLSQFYQKGLEYLSGGGEDNIYSLKSRLKVYLFIIGMLIISASSIYTYFLVERLKETERTQMEVYRQSQEVFGSKEYDEYPEKVKQFIATIVEKNYNIPIILTDDKYEIIDARNVNGINPNGLISEQDMAVAKKKLNAFVVNNTQPIYIFDDLGVIKWKIYSDDSNNLTLLKYYPFFQFILIAFFIAFGYIAFSTARRSEQNQVWVGMAKETAHQLGTPIAAILGWIEHLRSSHEGDEMTQEVVTELENDVTRLSLVADRFSKIGSAPELTPVNIYEELDRCREYMQRRAPRRVIFDFPSVNKDGDASPQYLYAKINSHLFDWVVENLLRNALDAMEGGEGKITAKVYEEPHWICVDVTDTGKGIPKNKFNTVFQPGFTTKKRGWGLGLSLAKRIIENYHGGKILVKDSELGKFTTFTIKLPKE
jgi:signal transduction histidine kinase